MNADGYVSTGSGVLDTNMFAYCGNNPVNNSDPTGFFFSELWETVKNIGNQIVQTIESLAPSYSSCNNLAAADGPAPIGDIAALTAMAVLTVGAIGYGVYKGVTKPYSKSISKAETKEKSVPVAPPKTPVYIYRFGGTNPGNLTPRLKDKSTGLSFSTIPKPGCAVTTIEQLNATGIVYAIQDKPGHVGVWPIGGTMEDWINEGSSSKWTIAVKSVVVKWDGGN